MWRIVARSVVVQVMNLKHVIFMLLLDKKLIWFYVQHVTEPEE